MTPEQTAQVAAIRATARDDPARHELAVALCASAVPLLRELVALGLLQARMWADEEAEYGDDGATPELAARLVYGPDRTADETIVLALVPLPGKERLFPREVD